MEKYDPRVDAYIEKSADFAKPILKYLRNVIHLASPQISETIKWGFPHFDYKGPVCHMASFKQHCAFGFWKAGLMEDPNQFLLNNDEAMGHLGKITSLADLPAEEILTGYIKNAIALNEEGIKVSKKPDGPKAELIIPSYFTEALSKYPAAAAVFQNFSYSHKKEYIEWITEAKTETTRQKRTQTTLEWLTEGKSRHWKYKKE